LVEAQIKSMGMQDSVMQELMENQRKMAPLQMEQMRFGLDSAKTAYDQSQTDRTWMLGRRGMLSDAQDTMSADAKSFNTEGKREELAAAANADVNAAFGAVRSQTAREMERKGVNPSSGKALATSNQLSIAQAAAGAGASNNARTAARMEGRALTDRVTNSLAGYPAMASGVSTTGAGLGASGLGIVNTASAGVNSGLTSASTVAGQLGANATGMYGAQASYKNAQDQLAANNDPTNAILGAATSAGMAYATGGLSTMGKGAPWAQPKAPGASPSDIRLKTDITQVGVLHNGLPVYTYRYKTGSDMMMGVMAHEVKKICPEAYVEGGAGNGFDAVDYSKLGV
jgi:hypothetical protein